MDIRKMSNEELELLSYNDIAYNIIKLDKEPKTTVALFREICDRLEMSENEFETLIADFFTLLTTDKRFILLNSGNWDLKENHVVNIVIDESEEGLEKEEEYDLDEDGIDDLGDEDAIDDDNLDELEGLEIIDEDEELEE